MHSDQHPTTSTMLMQILASRRRAFCNPLAPASTGVPTAGNAARQMRRSERVGRSRQPSFCDERYVSDDALLTVDVRPR